MTDQIISARKASGKDALLEILQESPEHINAILTEHKATPFDVALPISPIGIISALFRVPVL